MSIQLPSSEENSYWNLILKDGRVIQIPPQGVPVVKRKMAAKDPIHTRSEVIPFSEIKGFEKSSKQRQDTKLLEDTARAFKEPVITSEGDVKARWVKKEVTRGEYDKYHAKSVMYKYLDGNEGMVTVAMCLPVHMIDYSYMQDCTSQEERKLGY